jgi:stalled ribosome rescue protein Dom34
MSKNKKQFGVWMDSQQATIIGRDSSDNEEFVILGHAKNSGGGGNSNENAANNSEVTTTTKFFKEITTLMQNVDELHVTGTGQIQEQFIKFLSQTPQYKNVDAKESTSNKMSDEKLLEFMAEKLN